MFNAQRKPETIHFEGPLIADNAKSMSLMGQSSHFGCVLVTSGLHLRAQPVDATQALNLSAGVSNCKVSRGRSFS